MTIQKKDRLKLTPEQMFNIYMECNAPGAPVKMILQRHGLSPWDLAAIRKKIKAASLEALSKPGKPGRKQHLVPVELYQKITRELAETKDALAAVGHELSLLRDCVARQRNKTYISAQDLMDQGFSLLCYDTTRFLTDSHVQVWAIPVMILPYRYLLHIGYSLQSVTGSDLANVLKDTLTLLPEQLFNNLAAHSDRGSAMKASQTRTLIKNLLGAPVHFGRPHTPDDQSWIEAFIKTLKYHREAPASFATVDDIAQWVGRFPDIYNNDPHSSLKYVSPLRL